MRDLSAGLLTAGLLLVGASQTYADDTANAIIERAIKAHGGAANLAKLRVRQEKSKSTSESDGQTSISTEDTLIQLPDRWKCTKEIEGRGRKFTNIFVFNGEMGWANFGRQTIELKGGKRDLLYGYHVLTLTPLLKDPGFTLSALGEVKVNDRPALGVKVSAQDHVDLDLYFDKETGLLVKRGTRLESNQQVVNSETVYSDYKETDGLKWPRKQVSYRDGNKVGETEITELKFLERINDSEFDKP